MRRHFFYQLLFQKQFVCYRSAFDVQESVRRLSTVTGIWPFLSPFRQWLSGRVKAQNVTLARFIPFVGNPFAPIFYGSFQVRDGATVLEGYFALPLYSRIYHSVWLGLCLLAAVTFPIAALTGTVSGASPLPQWEAKLFFGLAPAVMLLFFVFYVKTSMWFARHDTAFIAEKVQRVLQSE